jgi:hypothetical protein
MNNFLKVTREETRQYLDEKRNRAFYSKTRGWAKENMPEAHAARTLQREQRAAQYETLDEEMARLLPTLPGILSKFAPPVIQIISGRKDALDDENIDEKKKDAFRPSF